MLKYLIITIFLLKNKETFFGICSSTNGQDLTNVDNLINEGDIIKKQNENDNSTTQNECSDSSEVSSLDENISTTEKSFTEENSCANKNSCENESSLVEVSSDEDKLCKKLDSISKQEENDNSLEEEQQSSEETENDCSTDNSEEEWSFENFINGTFKCIHQYTNGYFLKDETIKILEYIWKYISTDKNELAIFLSNSLHNTSFFKSFKNIHDDSLYACKGLLQIQGKENYEILSKISGTDYVTRPELLGIVSKSSIKDTGLFWKHLMSNKEMTWENSMDALKIENWVMYRKLQSKGEYPFDVLERREIYEFLLKIFN